MAVTLHIQTVTKMGIKPPRYALSTSQNILPRLLVRGLQVKIREEYQKPIPKYTIPPSLYGPAAHARHAGATVHLSPEHTSLKSFWGKEISRNLGANPARWENCIVQEGGRNVVAGTGDELLIYRSRHKQLHSPFLSGPMRMWIFLIIADDGTTRYRYPIHFHEVDYFIHPLTGRAYAPVEVIEPLRRHHPLIARGYYEPVWPRWMAQETISLV